MKTQTYVCPACLAEFNNWVDIAIHWNELHKVYYGNLRGYLLLYHPKGFTSELRDKINDWVEVNHLPYDKSLLDGGD